MPCEISDLTSKTQKGKLLKTKKDNVCPSLSSVKSRAMVAQDFSGLGSAQKPRKSSRGLTIASLAAGSLLLAIGVVVVFSTSGRPGAVELSDVDDDTFFKTGKSLASVGDKELGLADAAMKKHDLRRAQTYAKHAAKAYRYTLF
jgi:hypothetical protein